MLSVSERILGIFTKLLVDIYMETCKKTYCKSNCKAIEKMDPSQENYNYYYNLIFLLKKQEKEKSHSGERLVAFKWQAHLIILFHSNPNTSHWKTQQTSIDSFSSLGVLYVSLVN